MLKTCLIAGVVAGVCVLGCPPLGAAAPVIVSVATEGPNQFRVGLESSILSPPRAVWNVLTDYDHHAEILPYMSKSHINRHRSGLSAQGSERQAAGAQSPEPGAPLIVEQEGKIRILFWTFTMRVTQEVTEIPLKEMHFHAIAGDFQRLEGTWVLSPDGQTTGLRCQFLVQPKRRVPEWAVRFAARHYLAAMVRSLERHAEGRGF